MRQDQLTKVRAYFISLNLQELLHNKNKASKLLDISKFHNIFDDVIQENFQRILRISSVAQ